ncbi:MAG: hypothetical protein KDD70_18910 [Bdellovibrionales bacterium]|nr:hypothetical protein [Bdellovibrionales bacterium]
MERAISTAETAVLGTVKNATLAQVCEVGGYLSIIASIAIWMFTQGDGSTEAVAHAERFGIFLGLWAPTFFILANRYCR